MLIIELLDQLEHIPMVDQIYDNHVQQVIHELLQQWQHEILANSLLLDRLHEQIDQMRIIDLLLI